jgi:hypothetical protein
LIGRFGVSISFIEFWVQLLESLHTSYWLLYNFEVLNILFWWPTGVPMQNCK